MSLGGRAARGTAVTIAGQAGKFAIQAASIVILSRLISPEEFGIFTMIAALTALAAVVGDFGLSYAAIQAPTLTQDQKSNLFWVNAAIGATGSVLMFASAPLIAEFYGEPQLVPIAQVMSSSFLVLSLAVQQRAQLTRDLKFTALAISDVASQAVGLFLALALVAAGAGVWALVAQQLSAFVFQLIYSAMASGWWPGWPNRAAHIGGLLKFGANTMAGALVNYASTNVDRIALGRTAGAAEVGVYGRMYQLFALPLQQLAAPLTRVAIPVLSRLLSDDDRYMAFLARAQTCMAYIFSFFFAYIFAAASGIVPLVLGPGWHSGVLVLQLLCVGGLFQGLGYCYYWVFLSRARMDVQLWLGVATRAVTVAAVIAVSPAGMYAVAAASAGGLFLNWVVYASLGMRKVGISARPLIRVAWRPCLIALLYGAGGATLGSWLTENLGPWASVLLIALLGAMIVLICSAVFSSVRQDVRTIVATFRSGLARGGSL